MNHRGTIHQVAIMPLKKIVNDRGGLMEVQRNDDPHFPGFGQLYMTYTTPGITKAWYRHHRQFDQIALIHGEVLLVLCDARTDSPTRGTVQEIHVTGDRPKLVQIPPGLWHGHHALGHEPTILAHLNTVPFQFESPDQDTLPANDPSIPYRWPDAARPADGAP